MPFGEELCGRFVKRGELGMAEDGGLHLSDGEIQRGVAGAGGFPEHGDAQAGHDLPVAAKRIQISLGDAAAQVAVDVLQILWLGAVDVAREVEVEVVLRVGDFRDRHHAGVARVAFILPGEGVNDLVEVLLAQPVFWAILLEALGGINHEDAFACGGVFLVQHKDAGRDAGAEKEIGWQTDDGLEVAGADELLANDAFRIAPKQDTVRENAGTFAGAVHGADDVQEVGVVPLLLWRNAPSEALVVVATATFTQSEAGGPGLVREGRIGDDVVVSAKLLAVLELGIKEGVSREHVGRREVVQDHVHAGETGGGHVLLLAFKGDVFARLGGDFQQQRTGAAGGVVGGSFCDGVGRRDTDDLGHDAADFGRGVELTLALAALAGEVPHEVLIGVAQDVVVLGAVLREIERGVLEDGDEIAELLDLLGAIAELVRVVEVGEVAAGEAGVGVDERLDDLGVDLVADVVLALEGDHVLEARALWNVNRRSEVIGVTIFIGNVFDEQHEQDIVLVLAGIHAAAQFVARSPEGGIEIGFLDCHEIYFVVRGAEKLQKRNCCKLGLQL